MKLKELTFPVMMELKTFEDLFESFAQQGSLFHKKIKDKQMYYYYASYGDVITLIVYHCGKKTYKKYIGLDRAGVLQEANVPSSDTPFPITEIENDPMLNLALALKGEEDTK